MKCFYELLSLSLSVTPIIIILLCFNPILKKRYSAKWRYILWTALSICLLLPFSYVKKILVSLKVTEAVPNELLPSTPVIVNQLPKINSINLHNVNDSFGEILLVIYFVGVLVCLAYIIFSYIGFRRDIFRWGKKTRNYEIQTILKDEKRRLNIKGHVTLLICKKVSSPMLFGLIKPTLVLPSEAYRPEELRMILTHELVHLKRNDILIKTILTIASVVHWFNPAVHLMVKQANKDMEQSCDDSVLNGCNVEEKKVYCNIILNTAVLNNNAAGHVFSTNIVTNRKNLESRIKGIFDSSKKKRGIITFIAVILFVIISATIFNAANAEETEILPAENKFSDKLNKFADENDVGNENKVEIPIEDNGFAINNEVENSEFNNKNDNSKTVENANSGNLPATDRTQKDNAQQTEIKQRNLLEIQEEDLIKSNMSEIVIVDLNHLENQLKESETIEQ